MPIESHVHTTVESESEKFISSSISCVTGAGAAGVPGIPVFANSHSFIGHSSDGTDFDIGITKIRILSRHPYQEDEVFHQGGYVVRRRVKVWLVSHLSHVVGIRSDYRTISFAKRIKQ